MSHLRTVVHDPRAAVLKRLERACDRWAAREARFTNTGHYAEAEGAHQVVLYIVRAIEAESRAANETGPQERLP